MGFTSHEVVIFFLALAVLLGAAWTLGELVRRLKQPAVIGQLIAGVLLGPTVLGSIAPGFFGWLFPAGGNVAVALETITMLAVVLLLLVAGLEIDLSTVWRQGQAVAMTAILGTAVPFALGFGLAWAVPEFGGVPGHGNRLAFALFFGTALSISALPLMAKVLIDLNLFRSDLGMLVMGAAMLNDLASWLIFALVRGVVGVVRTHPAGLGYTVAFTIGFAVLVLIVIRGAVHRVFPWVQARLPWPGGVLSFTMVLALLGAAATEAIGVHALFGSFLMGIAVGATPHMRERAREIIHQFVSHIFAPFFLVFIGLRINFVENFNVPLVLAVLGLAFVGKIGSCYLGAAWGGLSRREALAVGLGMNARGEMGLILSMFALKYGVIGEQMFVALVFMAFITSLFSGPAIDWLISRRRAWSLADLIDGKLFVGDLRARDPKEAIGELATKAADGLGVEPEGIINAVWGREQLMSTALGQGVAVPHARLDGIKGPLVAVGLSSEGIDFNAPDGEPTHLIFLVLTPQHDQGAQLEIFADIARCFSVDRIRQAALGSQGATEFVATLKVADGLGQCERRE